jgi:hypothetical protein
MKRKTRLDYIPEAIRYLCLAVVFVFGIFSILATGGGGGSSGSSSGNTLVSEARVLVLNSNTSAPIQGANVRAVFLYKASNVTEESNCVTEATGRCVVTVTMAGQLADEVTLTVSQAYFYTKKTDAITLDSTGSVNANVYMTPLTP